MKDFRRIATRCDKLARNYASAVARCPRTKSEQKEDKSFQSLLAPLLPSARHS
jgi:hypothetical protein